jgi:hypothetical protein
MQTLSQSKPKARKAHWCEWCGRTIEPGEVYQRAALLGDDGLYDWANCLHCAALVGLCDIDGYDEGISDEDILEWEPPDIEALRWKVLWRKKWRRADGTLYPVPAKAAS